jgi:ABC-type antimicrobial peptide transport system permease subunit
LGLPASWLLTKLIQSQLYGVQSHDPLTIGIAVLAIAAIAAFAGFAPGRRASSIHPMEALRWE